MRVHEEREWVGDLIEGRKKRVGKEGKLVGRVQWGEEEYYEWVKARFGGAEEEEEELDIVEEVLSGKEEETPSMEVVAEETTQEEVKNEMEEKK